MTTYIRALIYATVSAFGLYIIYDLIFETAINSYVRPRFINILNNSQIGFLNATEALEPIAGIDNTITFVKWALFILIYGLVLYVFIRQFITEKESEYMR